MSDLPIVDHRTQQPRYWIPAAFTTLTLWLGMAAMLFALRHALALSAYAILAALVADNIDGRIARMTHSTSSFGKEYDSLCDMVAFGVAPAFAAACALQDSTGLIGWLTGLAYVTCAGLRLARFNSMPARTTDTSVFIGLPSPVAASAVACVLLFHTAHPRAGSGPYPGGVLILSMLIAGVLMISSVRFLSPKSMSMRGAVRLLAVLLLLATAASFVGVFDWFLAGALLVYLLGSLCLMLQITSE
jgi:CDP-diacylglycerol--serine O-phosphatidyltransferase